MPVKAALEALEEPVEEPVAQALPTHLRFLKEAILFAGKVAYRR